MLSLPGPLLPLHTPALAGRTNAHFFIRRAPPSPILSRIMDPKRESIGAHVLEYEPTLLHVRWNGAHSLDEQHQIYDRIADYVRLNRPTLLLFDLRNATSLTAEHRRASGEWWKKQQLESIALAHYGLGTIMRMMTGLIARAVELLSGRRANLENFATEAEARAWLERVRPTLRV